MNRFLMIKSTPEMRVVPKYYLNNPLQLLFNDNLKILNSKNCLLAHWSPWWPYPELHRIGGTKIKITCLELNILSYGFNKTFEGMFGP